MHPKFRSLYEEFEADRNSVMQQISNFTEEKLHYSARPGIWSLSQVLTHVLTTERLSLLYMKKKSLGVNDLTNSGIWESTKVVMMKITQRLPLRYKAPAAVVKSTPEALSLKDIITGWQKLNHDLQTFLDAISDKNVKKKIYKHPIFGRLNAEQALISMQEHFHHHMPQIKRLMK